MVLSGRMIKGYKILRQVDFTDECAKSDSFHDKLENCLLGVCRVSDIPAPIWLSKNTLELAKFRKTNFYKDQFTEAINFDRFEIKIIEI